jgi:hypothetical protein
VFGSEGREEGGGVADERKGDGVVVAGAMGVPKAPGNRGVFGVRTLLSNEVLSWIGVRGFKVPRDVLVEATPLLDASSCSSSSSEGGPGKGGSPFGGDGVLKLRGWWKEDRRRGGVVVFVGAAACGVGGFDVEARAGAGDAERYRTDSEDRVDFSSRELSDL